MVQCNSSDTLCTGLPLFWNFWKPGNVGILQRSGKNQGKGTKSSQGICLVRDIWLWHLGSEHHITYLYFIRCTLFVLWYGLHIWRWTFWVDFSQLLRRDPNFLTSGFRINKCAFVRYVVCNFVWKSQGFFYLESANPVCKISGSVACQSHFRNKVRSICDYKILLAYL